MQQVLIAKLHEFLINTNIDLLIALQEESKVSRYLKEKVDSVDPLLNQLLSENTPAYIIEVRCLDELTKDLRPSKFNYLTALLEEDFESDYNRFKENAILTYELINLIEVCKPVLKLLVLQQKMKMTSICAMLLQEQ